MKTTTILIVRHGETDWNKEGLIMGSTDISLNEVGHAQAKALGLTLHAHPLDAILSSPLTRTQETATHIASHHPLISIELVDDLKERSLGAAEGMPYEVANNTYPPLTYTITFNYTAFTPPNGETLDDVRARAQRVIEKIKKEYKGKTVAIITHGILSTVLVSVLTDISLVEIGSQLMPNTSISLLTMDEGETPRLHVLGKMITESDITR